MADIHPGPYNIILDERQYLGVDPPMGEFVVLLEPSVEPGKILWHVERVGNAITLMSLESRKFAGIEGPPAENELVVATDRPLRFTPRPGKERGKFKLLVFGNENLALGEALIKPFPPRTALRPADEAPEWRFRFLE